MLNYFLVLEKIYELLGVLGEVHPADMINNSEKLFRAYLGELKTQVCLKFLFHCFLFVCLLSFGICRAVCCIRYK